MSFNDSGSPSGLTHMPGQQLTTRSTAENQDFKPFWFSHVTPPYINRIPVAPTTFAVRACSVSWLIHTFDYSVSLP
jgi:hypothetical protein